MVVASLPLLTQWQKISLVSLIYNNTVSELIKKISYPVSYQTSKISGLQLDAKIISTLEKKR